MKSIPLLAICLFLLSFGARAQTEIVEIEKPQPAKWVAGVVADPSGVPIAGVRVEERSEDWKTAIRSTETDKKGRFSLSATPNKTLYRLQFGRSGFHLLRITVKLDKNAEAGIAVKLPIAT